MTTIDPYNSGALGGIASAGTYGQPTGGTATAVKNLSGFIADNPEMWGGQSSGALNPQLPIESILSAGGATTNMASALKAGALNSGANTGRMTLQEFMASNGIKPKTDEDGRQVGWVHENGQSVTADDYNPITKLTDTYNKLAAANFDYGALAKQMGYQGSDPQAYFRGEQDISGNPVGYGNYTLNNLMGSTNVDSPLYGAESVLKDYAFQPLGGFDQNNPQFQQQWSAGQAPDRNDWMGPLLQAGMMSGIGALAAFGPGGFAVGDAATGGAAAADASWGVNPRIAGDFSLAGGSVPQAASGLGLNTAGSGLGLTASGAGTAGAGLTGATAAGAGALLTPAITGGATGLPAVAGGSWTDSLGDFVKSIVSPQPGKNDPFSVGNLGGAALNYFGNSSNADALRDAATQAQAGGTPLNDPQRQQYQQQLAQLLSNPSAFYDTNPVVKAQMDLARQQFEANSAKMGIGGTQFNDYLKNVQNNAASTFNTQADLLGQLAGFKFPGGTGTSTAGQLNQAAAGADSNALAGFSNLIGQAAKNSPVGQSNIFDAAKNIFSLG